MINKRPITESDIDNAHSCFSYREDGQLIWKVSRGKAKVGKPAGNVKANGYLHVGVNGRYFKAHRLIWAMHYGDPGEFEVDHIDGNPLNNKIENMRLSTRVTNAQNGGSGAISSNKSSGLRGVSFMKRTGLWAARIRIDGNRRVHIGYFETKEEAHEAYDAARKTFHSGYVVR